MECPACHHANIEGARFCAKCGALLPASASPENDPLIGAIVGGRFRIVDVLGEGGMGRVYRGEQQMGTSVRLVAVKTLLAQYARDPQVLARFMRECGTVSELEHPNTIKVYDYGQTPTGELYIAMELLTGKSLESVLETQGALPPDRVDRIIAQVCGSLQEAHDKGIIHRDLKPANIQLSVRAGEEDYVKVLDFGIAKRDERTSKSEQKLTQQGTVLGTPPYMSPEQFRGQELDARSDIYSLGIMTYEMLTGRLPFEADTPWAWATQHMTAQPFPFEAAPMGGSIPPKMKAAVMRALQKDKAHRQGSVREFYADLTLGAARPSMLGVGMQSPSVPSPSAQAVSGTAQTGVMPSRPGQTQIGEPLFVTGPQAAPGRTMIDDGSSAARAITGSTPMHAGPTGSHQAPYAQAGHGQAPYGQQPSAPPYGQPTAPSYGQHPTTGSGQVFPAPAPPPAKKSPAPIIAAVAVLAVVGIVASVMLFKKKPSDGDSNGTEIALPGSGAPAVVLSDPIPSAEPATTASGSAEPDKKPIPAVKTTTGSTTSTPPPTTSGTSTAKLNDEDCQAAIRLASGGNTSLAVARYRACNGPSKAAAKSAIDASGARAVSRLGCGARTDANAAASIGASSGLNALKAKNCK